MSRMDRLTSPTPPQVSAPGYVPYTRYFTWIGEESDIREGKGRRCCLGDGLECRTSHLCSSKDDLKKGFCKNIRFVRVVIWCGVNQMIINFSEASIPPSVHSSFHRFLQIILVLILYSASNWINSVPPTSNDDLCLLFCLILLLRCSSNVNFKWFFAPHKHWESVNPQIKNKMVYNFKF